MTDGHSGSEVSDIASDNTATGSIPVRVDLPSLTSLRTFAALWVLVFHLGLLGVWALRGWEMGYTGVGLASYGRPQRASDA